MTDLDTEFDRMIDELAADIERTMRTVAIGGFLSGLFTGVGLTVLAFAIVGAVA